MTSISCNHADSSPKRGALFALGLGAFGIGLTEFVIMGLLPQVAADLGTNLPIAGLLISGYALGVTFGGPLLAILAGKLSHRAVLMLLMVIFTAGNLLCAISPSFALVLLARIVTGFAHGAFFGTGSVVAQALVPPERKASAIAMIFTGLTLATVLGLPFGTWLGQAFGWRSTFWAVAAIGLVALAAITLFVPRTAPGQPLSFGQLREFARPAPLLALAMTVAGYAGVFMVFTYIAPLLTDLAGIADAQVALYLLLFGIGLVIGNILGGWLADRYPQGAVKLTLLTLSLGLLTLWLTLPWLTALAMFAFGALAFATVAPLQARMMVRSPAGADTLGATLNISAFNLGNATGAWLGGVVPTTGFDLAALMPLAARLPLVALAMVYLPERT